MTFALNQFILEQWPQLCVYWPSDFTRDLLLTQVQENFGTKGHRGYRDGVYLVELPLTTPSGLRWRTRVVEPKEGQSVTGTYRSRVKGEAPRKQSGIMVASVDDLPEAPLVEAVVYGREVLAERNEPRTGADFDIITVLAHPTNESAPMNPGTLMSNHFGASGGTNTNMTPEQFEAALRKSYFFWKTRVLAYLA
jgi:hypothetical protein